MFSIRWTRTIIDETQNGDKRRRAYAFVRGFSKLFQQDSQ